VGARSAAYVGSLELVGVVEAARLADPSAPLVRGDELGLDPGPAIGRILDLIDEERAAGTISTREEALELARSLASAEAQRERELRLALQEQRSSDLAQRLRRLLGPFTGTRRSSTLAAAPAPWRSLSLRRWRRSSASTRVSSISRPRAQPRLRMSASKRPT
jgi:hypothetical protein